ncbi:hypothetical protein [Janibacter sp. GS2]|uniref:hypothetical protein n=1 Tax=Janibacter sp. GS2 TaxID=3442646 RepID=UPI003EBB6330
MATYTVRPLSDRTWLREPRKRERSPFDTSWTGTLSLLEREVAAIAGRHLVIGIDVSEKDLRLDGTLRARARAESPAVEVAFDSKHGPMLYRCDRYLARSSVQGPDWQQNVRAIAKTLEALRAVDRYGASSSGEQYRGYQQIAAAPPRPGTQPDTAPRDPAPSRTPRSRPGTQGAALARLREIAGTRRDMPRVDLVRRARRFAHPDRGGSAELWAEVDELARLLLGDGAA